ncbi:MAG: serine/threonine protein kinase, partial [Acidobacteria bacterium]|nr:serine/threonine protein kinase [Acidobacteriota bacterium]
MTPERWARVTELFDAACQLPTAARDAWLDASGVDADLRAEVRAMIEAYDTDPGYLEQPANPVPALDVPMTDALIGRRLGAWRLTRQIGRGGMGVVYEARRDDQEFDRVAAVKILPAWSAGFAERFRAERRVLAALDHPGIARLLDSGTSDDGIAWFVMEFVDGQSVTAWTTARRLPIRDRVALIERICDAVAYAHRHLVVHRDLKPANILVTADGQPKLLDFGIATLLSAEDGVAIGTTRTGHSSFTPEFASPEQIRGE